MECGEILLDIKFVLLQSILLKEYKGSLMDYSSLNESQIFRTRDQVSKDT